MERLFLRLWAVATALLVAGMIGVEVITWTVFSDDELLWWEGLTAPGYALAAEKLDAATEPEAALARLSQEFGVPVARVEAVPDQARRDLALGSRVGWAENRVFVPLSSGFLSFGPYEEVPTPAIGVRLALAAGGAALLGLCFWVLLAPLHRGQRALVRAADQLAHGDLSARVSAEHAPRLAAAFNHMAERTEQLVVGQQRLLRAASHELRTPIARMRLGVHLLAVAEDDREARADDLDADLAELDDLVDEILVHARLEAGAEQAERVELDLRALAARVIARQAPLGPSLRFELGEGLDREVLAAPRLLDRALSNLVGNARRHARGRVRVEAGAAPGRVEIRVEDDGPGLPAEQRAAALLPFTRFGEGAGHGMGLAIVARVAAWHGGEVALSDSPLGGLRVTLTLPEPGRAGRAP